MNTGSTERPTIAMLGYTRVGKTSLLAAMNYWFNSTVKPTGLDLVPDLRTVGILSQQFAKLEELAREIRISDRKGVAPSQAEESYNFDINASKGKSSVTFQFWDYPGEYLNESEERRKLLADKVRNSAVVIITVDAAALMEEEGVWHERINQPMVIRSLFQHAYKDLEQNEARLVIFAPVKCEKYVQDPEASLKLSAKIKEKYHALMNFFADEQRRRNIAVVTTPVQTVGGVTFSHVFVQKGDPVFYFKKSSPSATFQPKDGDQPLRYVLRFLFVQTYQDRRQGWGPLNGLYIWFRDRLGQDQHLQEAVVAFAQGCKTGQGFEVIQGRHLLNIE